MWPACTLTMNPIASACSVPVVRFFIATFAHVSSPGFLPGGSSPPRRTGVVSQACENHRPQRERFLLTLTESETFLTTCDLSTLCLHWTVNTGIHTAAKFVVTAKSEDRNAVLDTREGTGR